MVGGLAIGAWIALWQQCYAITATGVWRTHWPDNRHTLRQPALVVAMFDLVTEQMALVVAESAKQ